VYPLVIDDDGNARQAAVGGGWHEFPRFYFTSGHLSEVAVPCASREAQHVFRSGYELRPVDRHDLALLDDFGELQSIELLPSTRPCASLSQVSGPSAADP
jgi:lincosamide nucleotidyltransferase A/C/D/E